MINEKAFKAGSEYHDFGVWFNEKEQALGYNVFCGLFFVVARYNKLEYLLIKRGDAKVVKDHSFSEALLGGIVGGGVGAMLGAIDGAENKTSYDYRIDPELVIWTKDGQQVEKVLKLIKTPVGSFRDERLQRRLAVFGEKVSQLNDQLIMNIH